MRLKPKRFWALSYRDYLVLADGYHRREADKWQHTRYLATLLININREPDSEPVQPSELMWLPGDDERASESTALLSDADFEAELRRLDELYPVT